MTEKVEMLQEYFRRKAVSYRETGEDIRLDEIAATTVGRLNTKVWEQRARPYTWMKGATDLLLYGRTMDKTMRRR